MKSLSIIGCGKVGKTLGYLFNKNKIFKILGVLNRTQIKASYSVNFIGAGQPVTNVSQLPISDIYLISTSDDLITFFSEQLAKYANIDGSIIFHCSGLLTSKILLDCKHKFALTASAHPLFSFANPEKAISTFQQVPCAIEGEKEAKLVLKNAFKILNAKPFIIREQDKTLYHVGSTMASNNLVGLIETSINIFQKIGLSHTDALSLIAPLLKQTTDNIISLGTSKALTGPISRADINTVKLHLQALEQLDPKLSIIYKQLGKQLIELTRKSKSPDIIDNLSEIKKIIG